MIEKVRDLRDLARGLADELELEVEKAQTKDLGTLVAAGLSNARNSAAQAASSLDQLVTASEVLGGKKK